MSRKIVFSLIILSILTFLFTSAFTSQRSLNISLQSVAYKREKGVTFKFLVNGDVRKNDLKGNVQISDRRLSLHCNYAGDSTPVVVVCTAQKATAQFAGQPAVVTVAGHSFYFIIPARTTER